MHFSFLHTSTKHPKNGYPEYRQVITNEASHNTSEGSEFLDDAISREDESPALNENESAGHEDA